MNKYFKCLNQVVGVVINIITPPPSLADASPNDIEFSRPVNLLSMDSCADWVGSSEFLGGKLSQGEKPRIAQARALMLIEPSALAGSRCLSRFRRCFRRSESRDAMNAGAGPVPPKKGFQ